MTDYQRIEAVLKFKNQTARALSIALGLKTPQIFYDIKAGKCGISKSLASRIQELFYDIDEGWLLTGEGSMLKSDNVPTLPTEEDETQNTTLMLPVAARGGTLCDFSVAVTKADCEKIVCPIQGVDFGMRIYGDSMSPEYPNGSVILLKKINEQMFIEWGKVYVLDTTNGAVIKKLMPTDDKEVVKCVSLNPDYPPFEVSLKDTFGIYRVLMVMVNK